ncbi:LacI family transcriptional regulator [Alicyclobacillaceae bacterium I2511]|nr:LacI family transcriptional regulator [Alicyclobacillaceae bacterium I2511]
MLLVSGCGSTAPQANSGTTPSPNSTANGTQSTGTNSGKHYTFELITKSNASPYWLAVKQGADDAAQKYGVTVNFEAPASGTDLATQLSMINNSVTAHVDGIILAAQSPSEVAPVQNAEKAGIPVVTVDSGVSPNVADSFLATSNIAASKAIAQYMVKLIGTKGAYAVIDFNEESSTGIERPQGWNDGMAGFPNYKFIGMQICNNSVATSQSETEALLQAHPNINLMFGANDRSALGIANVIKNENLKGKVYVAGFDADLGEMQAIKAGYITASILQYPYQMGYQAVQELIKIKQGQTVPKVVDTPYYLVTAQNINTPAAIKAIQQYVPSYKG